MRTRLRVGVIKSVLIPRSTEIVVDGCAYDIAFEVESHVSSGDGGDTDMLERPGPGKGKEPEDEDDDGGEDRDVKRLKNSSLAATAPLEKGGSSSVPTLQSALPEFLLVTPFSSRPRVSPRSSPGSSSDVAPVLSSPTELGSVVLETQCSPLVVPIGLVGGEARAVEESGVGSVEAGVVGMEVLDAAGFRTAVAGNGAAASLEVARTAECVLAGAMPDTVDCFGAAVGVVAGAKDGQVVSAVEDGGAVKAAAVGLKPAVAEMRSAAATGAGAKPATVAGGGCVAAAVGVAARGAAGAHAAGARAASSGAFRAAGRGANLMTFAGTKQAVAPMAVEARTRVVPAAPVRSSGRLAAMPDADDTAMDKAARRAMIRNLENTTGYPYGNQLYPYVVLTSACGNAGAYGFWVQPTGDGSKGFVQPVWVA